MSVVYWVCLPDAIRLLVVSLAFLAGVLLIGAVGVGLAEDDVVVDGPIISNLQQHQQMMRIGVGSFDQILFQNDGNGTKAEQQILTRIELQIAEIDKACQLNDDQRQKLQLAARGDLQRLLSEAAPLRLKFNKLVNNGTLEGPNAMEVYQRLHQELQPLQMRFNLGLTDGPASLFMKVLSRTLTAEQQAQYDILTTQRRRFRYQANIAVCLLNLEDTVFLSEAQRDTITTLLLAMPPPRHMGQYETYIILGRMTAIPTEKLEPLFSPRQWRALSTYLDQYRTTARSLVESGLLEPEDLAPPVLKEMP